MIKIKIGYGEAFDRMSIQQIKSKKTKGVTKKRATRRCLNLEKKLHSTNLYICSAFSHQKRINPLYLRIRRINTLLWDLENKIRNLGSTKNGFESVEFREAAKDIYRANDLRTRLKRRIDEKCGLDSLEVKHYS